MTVRRSVIKLGKNDPVRIVAVGTLLLLLCHKTKVQKTGEDEVVIRKGADYILREAAFAFQRVSGDAIYASTAAIPEGVEVKFKSKYGAWHYTNSVIKSIRVGTGIKNDLPL